MELYIFIGIGGMIGAIGRAVLSEKINEKFPNRFPLGTFVINIMGSFLLGLALTINSLLDIADTNYSLGISSGILGAFTTFATFNFEILTLLKKTKKVALWYLFSTLLFGLIAALVGVIVGKIFFHNFVLSP